MHRSGQSLCIRDNKARTNNAVESFHSGMRGRVKVAHPNMFAFPGHLQRETADTEVEIERTNRGFVIRRAKKRMNVINDASIKTCITRYDNGHKATVLACSQPQCRCALQRY